MTLNVCARKAKSRTLQIECVMRFIHFYCRQLYAAVSDVTAKRMKQKHIIKTSQLIAKTDWNAHENHLKIISKQLESHKTFQFAVQLMWWLTFSGNYTISALQLMWYRCGWGMSVVICVFAS